MVTWSLSLWHVVRRHVILSEGIKVVFLPSCTLSSLVNLATIELPPLFGLYLYPFYIGDHRRESNQGSVFRKEHSFSHPYALQALYLTSTMSSSLYECSSFSTLPTIILPYGDPTILQHTSRIRVH